MIQEGKIKIRIDANELEKIINDKHLREVDIIGGPKTNRINYAMFIQNETNEFPMITLSPDGKDIDIIGYDTHTGMRIRITIPLYLEFAYEVLNEITKRTNRAKTVLEATK